MHTCLSWVFHGKNGPTSEDWLLLAVEALLEENAAVVALMQVVSQLSHTEAPGTALSSSHLLLLLSLLQNHWDSPSHTLGENHTESPGATRAELHADSDPGDKGKGPGR